MDFIIPYKKSQEYAVYRIKNIDIRIGFSIKQNRKRYTCFSKSGIALPVLQIR